jgi:SAM-dependent methyltransferase
MRNINTEEYWNRRFSNNDNNSWRKKKGEKQTIMFANEIAKRLKLPHNFDGTLLDFGCALGDAIPIYARKYPRARIIGVDFSSVSIEICKEKYGNMANFVCIGEGGINTPLADVIVMSNVLEHISNDRDFVENILDKCSNLYIAVPFQENIVAGGEHINSYNECSFEEYGVDYEVYLCRGIYLIDKLLSFINIEMKNILRPLFGKPKYFGGLNNQILFHLKKVEKI